MTVSKWNTNEELYRRFRGVGRALLTCDIEDSHSGNIAMRWHDPATGREQLVITSTGSQKGDLEPSNICLLSPDATDYGYYKASSETDIHARILALEGVDACVHAHVKHLAYATFDDQPKPNQPAAFVPVDPLGHYHLGGSVPVDWFAVPSGSKEMAEKIPARLAEKRVMMIQGHGAFAKARTIEEALFRLCVAESAGRVAYVAERMGVDLAALRERVRTDADSCFSHVPDEYAVGDDDVCDFPDEDELLREFRKTGARIFESRLSPLHSGSLSLRGMDSLLYAPKAAMPRDIGGPLRRVPLTSSSADSPELETHREIYRLSNFQTVAHCYIPEAEALAHFRYPGEDQPVDRIVPIDAEGSFFYLVIPVVEPHADIETLVRLLHDYKVVVVRGGGVWGAGLQSLSEVLHHPSSVREICLYRLAAHLRGFDLRKLEPAKARKW